MDSGDSRREAGIAALVARFVDAFNRAVAERVQRDGAAFLTTTELHGRPVLRACIVNFRTTDADLDALIEAIVTAGESVR